MFKGIGDLLSSAAGYLDKNKNAEATEEKVKQKDDAKLKKTINPAESPTTPNTTISSRKASSAVMTSTKADDELVDLLTDAAEDIPEAKNATASDADIDSRKASSAVMTSTKADDELVDLLTDTAEDIPKSKNTTTLDFEEGAVHLTKEDAKAQELIELKPKYYDSALSMISEIIDTSKFYNLVQSGYNIVTGGSDLTSINKLIDCFNNTKPLSEDLLNRLGKIEQTQIHNLLASQIIAKNPDIVHNNTLIKYLFNIQNYIEKQIALYQETDNTQNLTKNLDEIIKRMLTDTFKQVQDGDILTGNKLQDQFIHYEFSQYDYNKIKRQFIVDLDRYNINCKLLYDDKLFWSSSELQQDYNKIFDKFYTQTEKEQFKEQFFNKYEEKIFKYISHYCPKNQQDITNAIILEQTQSGMALAFSVVSALKDSIFKDLLPETNTIFPFIPQDYTRNDSVIDLSAGHLTISTSFSFNNGISLVKDGDKDFFNSDSIIVKYSLSVDMNDLAKSEYKDVSISFRKKPIYI